MKTTIVPRGAAAVELALLTPFFVAAGLFATFFEGLTRARLDAHEAARFAAFEVADRLRTDHASVDANDDAILAAAVNDARIAVRETYPRLRQPSVQTNEVALEVQTSEAFADAALPSPDASADLSLGPLATAAMSPAREGLRALLTRWRLDSGGFVEVKTHQTVRSQLLPASWLPGPLAISSRVALIGNDWSLREGADALMSMKERRAGVHVDGTRHGLHHQVDRMTFTGIKGTSPVPGLESLQRLLGLPGVEPWGTFVVAHNYGLASEDRSIRSCTSSNGVGDPTHPSQDGLNNLLKASSLDSDRRACFDTMPFRDTSSYEGSLPVQQFRHRGPFFAGCRKPMADDPGSSTAAGGCE